jgi:hypothetical protein
LTEERFGPDDSLTVFFRAERDGFFTGRVVFLDEALISPMDRRRFLTALDAATEQLLGNGGFTDYGVTWVESTMTQVRASIAANLEDFA